MEEKIERKLLAHYVDATPGQEATYERIGKDLEEYNIELNAEVQKKKNIWGETAVNVSSYEASGEVGTYYAESGTKLFAFLQDIIDNRKVLDKVKTTAVEVHSWEDNKDSTYTAYKEDVYVEVKSYGGDHTGYQIPFSIHYTGNRTKGKFNPSTKAFTE